MQNVPRDEDWRPVHHKIHHLANAISKQGKPMWSTNVLQTSRIPHHRYSNGVHLSDDHVVIVLVWLKIIGILHSSWLQVQVCLHQFRDQTCEYSAFSLTHKHAKCPYIPLSVRVECVLCIRKTLSYTARIATLLQFAKTMGMKSENLAVSGSIPPFMTIMKKIIFPSALGMGSDPTNSVHTPALGLLPIARISRSTAEGLHVSLNPNPFPFLEWRTETTKFIQRWWLCPPNIPDMTLLGHWDLTRFVLAQYYFCVAIDCERWESKGASGLKKDT